MKTFRNYIEENDFEEVWPAIVEIYEESEEIKPVYAQYYDKLKELPFNPRLDEIKFQRLEFILTRGRQPLGMNDSPEYLIDKKISIDEDSEVMEIKSNEVAAILVYWASFHTFMTSKEHDDDLHHYLEIITSGDPSRLSEYLSAHLYKKDPCADIKDESLEQKNKRFWKSTLDRISPGDWRDILLVLKRAIEYNIGFMRGYADHAGREHDADRMQLCCRLIDIATLNKYPDNRGKKALKLLFGILAKEITGWDD
ncbi:MAG: hypothetical protein K2N28_01740 [Muribaculaceae bacterium]|nr:hypothetical protein [Muribaculaceae bacterium]